MVDIGLDLYFAITYFGKHVVIARRYVFQCEESNVLLAIYIKNIGNKFIFKGFLIN